MISFIWPRPAQEFLLGIGGSETYTFGQVHELRARGIEAEIVTLEGGEAVSANILKKHAIRPLSLDKIALLEKPVFVLEPLKLDTKHAAYVILHCPPPPDERGERSLYVEGVKNRKIIVTSRYSAKLWAEYLGISESDIAVVYPFAEKAFGAQHRPERMSKKTRVLLANRLHPDKGIYTFLASLHFNYIISPSDYQFDVVSVAADSPDGKLIAPMLHAHPYLRILQPRKDPQAMAALMSEYDVVVMPSNAQFYHETFGMNSVEAQHAGCRVVASNDGGLPETDCGGLTLVEPDNAYELALGIAQAATLPPLSVAKRRDAIKLYTVEQSVDALLNALQ